MTFATEAQAKIIANFLFHPISQATFIRWATERLKMDTARQAVGLAKKKQTQELAALITKSGFKVVL